MDLITRWLWIVLIVVVVLLLVHPRSQAPHVIGALSNEATANIKVLQGQG